MRGGRNRSDGPTALRGRTWARVLVRTAKELRDDHAVQLAAALTFFSVLALFPALLALVSVLGLLGAPAVQPLVENVSQLAPGTARDITLDALRSIQDSSHDAGLALALGLVAALWSASAYVGAFIPAANIVWEVDEARPLLRKLLVRMLLTVALLVLVAVTALSVVLTGPIAREAGSVLGIGEQAVDAWSYGKWPLLAAAVMVLLGILYRAAPNVRHPGWRWVVPGTVLAVGIWILASLGFALYVDWFGAYSATYGGIGGVIVFLLWLWIANLAILIGAEFTAELERARAVLEEGSPMSSAAHSAPPRSAPGNNRAHDHDRGRGSAAARHGRR